MTRKLVLILAFVGMLFAGAAQARGWSNFSIGYSDYGRHGGYSINLGGFGGHGWGGFGYQSPGWYGSNYRYGYGNQWRDPWYLSSYRRGYYNDCYGCYSRGYYPSYGSYSYYGYPRHYRSYGGRHHRHHDRYGYSGQSRGYDRNYRDNDYRSGRYGRNESAHDRARADSRYLDETPRGRAEN